MKRLLFCYIFLFASLSVNAQEKKGFYDYKTEELVTIDSITYVIRATWYGLDNPEVIQKEVFETLDEYTVSIYRLNEPIEQFNKFGEYPDGTFNNNPDEYEEVIIKSKQEMPLIIHAAWKKAFPKEEREANPNGFIIAFPILDRQGKIVAQAFLVDIHKKCVIQPEQIAILDRELRKNVVFDLKMSPANKFIRIPARIPISFKSLLKMPDIELKPKTDDFSNIGDLQPVFGRQ